MTERDLEKLSRDGDRAIARLVRRMQRHGRGHRFNPCRAHHLFKDLAMFFRTSQKRFWLGIGAVFALALPIGPALACPWQIVSISDGDTLVAHVPCLPEPLQRVLVRVVGVDTPEAGSKARCDYERALAARATALTEALVMRSGRVELEFVSWDRWGGRADAIVKINGVTLADALIRAGLARKYDGGKRLPWCE